MPPNVAHLCQTDDGNDTPSDVAKLSASNFLFDIVTFHGHPNPMKLPNDPSFGLSFSNDPVVKHTFVTNIAKRSATASLCSSHKSSRNKLCGARILEIGHENVVAAANATNCLALLHNQGVGEDQIPITFHSRPSQVPPTFANAPTRTDSLQTTPNGVKMKVQRTMQPSQTVLPIAPLTQTGCPMVPLPN